MGDIVEHLTDKTYAGELRHLQSWAEIDELFQSATSEILHLREEVERIRRETVEDIRGGITPEIEAATRRHMRGHHAISEDEWTANVPKDFFRLAFRFMLCTISKSQRGKQC